MADYINQIDRISFELPVVSAFECVPILEICCRRGFIDKAKSDSLKNALEDISKMLSGLINS